LFLFLRQNYFTAKRKTLPTLWPNQLLFNLASHLKLILFLSQSTSTVQILPLKTKTTTLMPRNCGRHFITLVNLPELGWILYIQKLDFVNMVRHGLMPLLRMIICRTHINWVQKIFGWSHNTKSLTYSELLLLHDLTSW
jgi:hypothetical protein